MSEQCNAKTKSGNDCRAAVVVGANFCASHGDPNRAVEVGRIGGRRNRHYVETEEVTMAPPSTPEEVKAVLAKAMVDVRTRRLDPRIAHTLTYMSSVLLRAIDSTEVEQRLARVEETLRGKGSKS